MRSAVGPHRADRGNDTGGGDELMDSGFLRTGQARR